MSWVSVEDRVLEDLNETSITGFRKVRAHLRFKEWIKPPTK